MLRQLLTAAVLLLSGTASALPSEVLVGRQRAVQQPSPSAWVSVDATGKAYTIQPTVTLFNGAITTISPPPESLTKSGTYTLSPTGVGVTTHTGVPPVATATASNGAGVFLACNTDKGADAPFCQPRSGSQLNPGKTYYITWSRTYFADPDTTEVEVQVQYLDGGRNGFTSGPKRILATQGYYPWTIDSNFLQSQGHSSLNVSIGLSYYKETSNGDSFPHSIQGPTVLIINGKADGTGGATTNPIVIAVPVVIAVVAIGLLSFCIWSWRRHGKLPRVGILFNKRGSTAGGGGGSGQGYGIRQSRAQRAGPGFDGLGTDQKTATPSVGIQLTDRDSWSPTAPSGVHRNVFREEVKRQERER